MSLYKWLRYQILKPRIVRLKRLGNESYVRLPRRLEGAQFIEIGERVTIHSHSWINAISHFAGRNYQPRITIGNDVQIGHYVCITAIDEIMIGEGCLFSEYVYVSDSSHGINPESGLLTKQPLESKGPVRIGAHCFIGYRTSILPGVELGDHCIVGAHSVVTHSFPAYSMVAGVPARCIKTYSPISKVWTPCRSQKVSQDQAS